MIEATLVEYRPIETDGRLDGYSMVEARCAKARAMFFDERLHVGKPRAAHPVCCPACEDFHPLAFEGEPRQGEPLWGKIRGDDPDVKFLEVSARPPKR